MQGERTIVRVYFDKSGRVCTQVFGNALATAEDAFGVLGAMHVIMGQISNFVGHEPIDPEQSNGIQRLLDGTEPEPEE